MFQHDNYRVRYATVEIESFDIHLTMLRDNQQFYDKNHIAEDMGISSAQWPLFGIVWDSSKVLSHLMASYNIKNKRILELGCGLGLASLLLNERDADITATDYHPEVGRFLKYNCSLNSNHNIPYFQADWHNKKLVTNKFDLIIGSDVLYERTHVDLLSSFINLYANEKCEIIIVDPGRGNHNTFCKKMSTYGFSSEFKKPTASYLDKPFKGRILYLTR
ncbi:methyltransferase [Arcobacter sp. CECT 8985]|uniref:class I SAM-dependent methyltransferase n=1 Tax=Arcobacter sp. CECT 8985 TaxID=1935424 RepID=UPI00100BC781|nr:methyltransferase domain-containing protein [Arcobacter sp. CECT 8985]RXJ86359.1 histidine kinase [Arcobacter sp. CECT 8985]